MHGAIGVFLPTAVLITACFTPGAAECDGVLRRHVSLRLQLHLLRPHLLIFPQSPPVQEGHSCPSGLLGEGGDFPAVATELDTARR